MRVGAFIGTLYRHARNLIKNTLMQRFTLKRTIVIAIAALFAGHLYAEVSVGTEFVQEDLVYKVLSLENNTVSVRTNDIDLVDVVIPETVVYDGTTFTVTETETRGFEKMKSLLTIDIPKTIVKFGKHTFNECSNLEKTIIHDVNAWVQIDFSGTSLANPAYKSENLYLGDKLLEEVNITVPITEINPLTFYYCKTIKKVILPSTVKKIGKWGFYKCGVEEIVLPDSLTTSESYAFQYSGLTRLEMPSNYTNMASGTFLDCKRLKSVKLPSNMKTLVLNTFQGCNALEEVEFNEGLETIKKGAFVATSIKKLNLPKSLKNIENQAFLDDIRIEEITIGPNVKFIGYLAFYIQDATRELFNWKSPLHTITCEATTPPTLQIITDKNGVEYNMAWNDEVYEQATLFVPKGCVPAYREAAEWNRFKNIKEIGSSLVSGLATERVKVVASHGCINIEGVEMPVVEVFDITGSKVFSGRTNTVNVNARGVYMVRCNGSTTKVLL